MMNNSYAPYGSQYYNQQYEQNLQNIMRDAQNKLNQLHNPPQPQQQVPITQNFQLTPSSGLNGIKYAEDIEEVKRQQVFGDTIFVNKEYSSLWLKSATGDIKSYELIEIVEKDEKDRKIDELMAKIESLEKEIKNNEPTSDDTNASEPNEDVKSKRAGAKGTRK